MRLPLPFARTSILLLILTVSASAQWVEEQYPLQAGFNAIWLSIDCSEQTIEDLLPPSTNVEEVWQWNASASATRFTQTPAAPDQSDSQWKVWRRDPSGHPASTLGLLTSNAAYLVKVADGTSPFQLALTGKPAPPDYRWKSSGVNFVGFPSDPATPPTFTNFLSFSEVLKNAPPVFFYDGGELGDNPRRLVTPNTKPVVRGHAYWVQTSDYTDFYGPLQVTVLRGGGLDYGRKLTSATVRVKNASDPAKNQTITATIALAPSAPAPGGGVPPQVALRLRGPRDANLQFTYTDLPTSITLAPGEQRDLVLDADRTQMSVPDQFHAGILQVSDSLDHTRIDLPVSATGSSRNGVWIGAAILDSVNQVEMIRGPEFDAPVGTPDGESPETTTIVETTTTTTAGITTREHEAPLSVESGGEAYLGFAGLTANDVEILRTTALDLSFGPVTGFLPDQFNNVTSIAVQPDGRILFGGYFLLTGGGERGGIGRLNADGSLDAGFGIVTTSHPIIDSGVSALALQPDGKILVGGDFTTIGGQARSGIARLNADGTVDAGFDPGAGVNGWVNSLVLQPDGKVVIGGNFSSIDGQPRENIARLNADATVDLGFDPGADAQVYALALQPNGQILAGGWFTTLGGQPRDYIGRLNSNGTVDAGFNPGADPLVGAFALQADGKILVGGSFTTIGGQPRSGFARLNADGSLDASFNPGMDRSVNALAVQGDGKILVGGRFTTIGGVPRDRIARLDAVGTVDSSFAPKAGDGLGPAVQAFALQADGKILVGGWFTTLDGLPQNNLGQLLPDSLALAVPDTNYTLTSSPRATVTNGGSGYSEPPVVTLVGGGGVGAEAEAVLNGAVRRVLVGDGGSGHLVPPIVEFFGGGGSGTEATAIIDGGLVTDVVVTNGGSGYTEPPVAVLYQGNVPTGVFETTISGSVDRVTITESGSGYTAAPAVEFQAADGDETGDGARATVYVTGAGLVSGADVVSPTSPGGLQEGDLAVVSLSSPAPAGTPDGTVTSLVVSTSRLVTLNGKSHLRTRRVSTGEGAAAPSNFPVRLILHSPASGPPTLLQQIYLGQRDGQAFAGPEEESIAALVKGPMTKLDGEGQAVPVLPGDLGRASSASFPRGEFWTGAGSLASAATFTVTLGHNAETNPFLHTYHPDHDNWDARYESPLADGVESYTITRDIVLQFNSTPPPGVSDLSWGVTTLGGTYTEALTGLRAGEGIAVSGNFILHQVSEVPTLTTP